MTATQLDPLTAFQWTPQPQAEALVKELLGDFLGRSSLATTLSQRMRDESGTRFIDWLDRLTLPISTELGQRLQKAGFVERDSCFIHEGSVFPRIVPRNQPGVSAAIKVESVTDFLAIGQTVPEKPVEGTPLAPLRRALISTEKDTELWIV